MIFSLLKEMLKLDGGFIHQQNIKFHRSSIKSIINFTITNRSPKLQSIVTDLLNEIELI